MTKVPVVDGNPANMTLAASALQLAGHTVLSVTRCIPVIALTALAMKGDEARIRAAGCDGYIAKPIPYREFLEAVHAQLARP